MTNIKDFADKNGFINWGRYQATRRENGEICDSCGNSLVNTVAHNSVSEALNIAVEAIEYAPHGFVECRTDNCVCWKSLALADISKALLADQN